MHLRIRKFLPNRQTRLRIGAIACVPMLAVGPPGLLAQETAAQAAAPTTGQEQSATIPPEQLDSLVAPIALYPDSLLTQTLVASTYPLEVIQLQQWLLKNPDLEGDALMEAVGEQPWDPAIQSMAVVPDAVNRLADDIQWATELGNAFLSQQQDLMDAVQRMRQKADGQGALESNEQQVVEKQVIEQKTVIIIQPADPEIIYVPSYSPTVVYGPPIYPYPPVYYPPYTPGTAFMAFSIGFIWGAAIGGSCCHYGWGGHNVNINVNNHYNVNRGGGGGNWSHNPAHRGGAPYSNRATANRYGGTARGDSLSSRQGAGQLGNARSSTGQRAAAGQRGGSSVNRAGTQSGGSRIGSRNIPSSSRSGSALGSGGASSFSGSKARASSRRGASSMGGRRGGGGRRR